MKYAHFDPASGTVLNWMDTEAYSYVSLPQAAELIELDGETWEAWHGKPAFIVDGALSETAPVRVPTLSDVKAAKLAELSAACSARMAAIKSGYPAEEVQSWDKQESEARAYIVSSSAATPLLSALATARGITLADLASRVIAKADLFAAASGAIIGKRQRYEDQVTTATDAATVEAISWQD
jgi:cell pole-organizing protein PopZ